MSPADLAFAGISRQAELIRAGEITPRELVEVYLDRIERIDPELNAFRAVYAERALVEADQALSRIRAGERRPLLGVPVALKDNVDLAGEPTGHGSDATGDPAPADAELVRRLRDAGAIVLGKTNLSELAIFPFTETAARGRTHNPWRPGRSAGGSSGGSGAAVAAGLVGAASATDGGGSIRVPAACNGLFGLKPQRGRVSLAPDDDHWNGLTVAGVLTRTVRDTALYLDAVAAVAPPGGPLLPAADRQPGSLRIAVSYKPSSPVRVDAAVRRAVGEVAAALGSLGHSIEQSDPDYGQIAPLFGPLWVDGAHRDAARTTHPELLERRTRRLSRAGAMTPRSTVDRARRAGVERARRLNRLFDRFDVLLTPAMPNPPDPLGRFEGRSTAVTVAGSSEIVAFMVPWNVTGQPAAVVPVPAADGSTAPLAAQLVAPPDGEAVLVQLAAQLERELRWPDRRPPID